MPEHPDLLLWVDLETTGSDEEFDEILEAAFIITNKDLVELGSFERVYSARIASVQGMIDRVHEMHVVSRLLEEVYGATRNAHESESDILEWLRNFGKDQQFALAGSGVSHFDRRFMNVAWPRLVKKLTYWTYDVGVVRRVLRDLVGMDIPDLNDQKPHRAMADLRLHLAEMKSYRDQIKDLVDFKKGEFESIGETHWNRFYTQSHPGKQEDCDNCKMR